MGIINRLLGGATAVTAVGHAVTGMAEVFTENSTRKMELSEQARAQAVKQFSEEFKVKSNGIFDSFINGLNRLPRPFLALGTMGLFTYAMIEPAGFGLRMEGLQQVPEPLWWLLGVIVGFYFGAREAHYFRHRSWPNRKIKPLNAPISVTDDFSDNAALRDWADKN